MELQLSVANIELFKALANENRIKILNILANESLNISEIAEKLKLSKTIISRHINLLEDVGLLTSTKTKSRGNERICTLNVDEIYILMPNRLYQEYKEITVDIPIGSYDKYQVKATCGMANEINYIGKLDNPNYFLDPNRISAQIIWFSEGYLEYSFPNPIRDHQKVALIEISFEISSEFPESNYIWPSDISFILNGNKIGNWIAPGDFSDIRGLNNPSWWPDTNSQYGLLKHLRISKTGTYLDGDMISHFKLANINFATPHFSFRFSNTSSNKVIGGITLFGKKFGNHKQDIRVKFYYE